SHTYRVQAVDAAGNASEKSEPASATASAPQVSLTPTSVTFDDRLTGSTSATQTITVENHGDADLSISSAAITGADAADFAPGAGRAARAGPDSQDSARREDRLCAERPVGGLGGHRGPDHPRRDRARGRDGGPDRRVPALRRGGPAHRRRHRAPPDPDGQAVQVPPHR